MMTHVDMSSFFLLLFPAVHSLVFTKASLVDGLLHIGIYEVACCGLLVLC